MTSSSSRPFFFGSNTDEFDLAFDFGRIDLENDVFVNKSEHDDMNALGNDSDNSDKEVEELLREAGELGHSNTVLHYSERNSNRPRAPSPVPEVCVDDILRVTCAAHIQFKHDLDKTMCHSYKHGHWNKNRNFEQYFFRPIGTYNVSQTQCSDVQPVSNEQRYHIVNFTASHPVIRPRIRSEGDGIRGCGSLPDIVPAQSGRCVSLPDLVSLRQVSNQQMGKELRRIGDEFNSCFRDKKTQTVSWSHFVCSLNFQLSGYLKTVRRMLSPGLHEITEDDLS